MVMEKYHNKPAVVEAVKLTFENQQEVKDWCGGKTWSRPPMRAVTGITLAVNFNVPFGHYITKDEDGIFHYLSPEIFEKSYDKVEE